MKPQVLTLLIITSLFSISCRKDKSLMENFPDEQLNQKNKSQSFDRLVSYDASHDVLVFNSFEDVGLLERALYDYSKNYPYNQENTSLIFTKFQDIRNNGFTNGNANNGKVKLSDLELLLLNSYPLSDSVLNALIDLNDAISPNFPPPFMRTVLTANVPFTYGVSQKIINSQIPSGIQNQILVAHDDAYIIPDFAYNDFLAIFPSYNSLYEAHQNSERTKLENGIEPGTPEFYTDFINDSFLSLVLNAEKEVYVQGYLIKLYNDCRTAIFQNGVSEAYTELAFLDEDGFAETPTNLEEPSTGLPVESMLGVFPMNYSLIDFNNIDFNDDNEDDPIGLTNFNSFDVVGCPQSSFAYGWNSENDFEVQFDNLTGLFFPGNTIYHYWQFGDGTGSFQNSPNHVYAEPGDYLVRLTSFTADCGCWDVKQLLITIPDPVIHGVKECYCSVDVDVQGVLNETGIVVFNANAFDDLDLSAFGEEYYWVFGDGLFEVSTNPTVSHYYPYAGEYTASLQVKLSNGCYTDGIQIIVNVPNDDANLCCDKRQNLNTQTLYIDDFNDVDYKLTMNDSYTGNDIFLDKIHGCQKLWRKKSNGNWTGQKGHHYIQVDAVIYFKDPVTGQKCANVDHIFDLAEPNETKISFDFPYFQEPFGVAEVGTIHILHQVWLDGKNNLEGYFEKVITLGEQNCD